MNSLIIASRFAPRTLSAAFSTKHETDFLKEKEHALEEMFFTKQEKETLAKLLHKINNPPEVKSKEEKLKAVLDKHGVKLSPAVFNDVLNVK